MKEIVTNNELRDLILELKSEIKEVKQTLSEKIDESNKRLQVLEEENSILKSKLEYFERHEKKNNVVIYGLNVKKEDHFIEAALRKLNEVLNLDLKISDLNNGYYIGKGDLKPIKLEFLSYFKKLYLTNARHKLKGSGIFINDDLTIKEQKQNKLLRDHLKRARKEGFSGFIKRNKLCVNKDNITTTYKVEELQPLDTFELDEGHELPRDSVSAPPTPTVHNSLFEEIVVKDKVECEDQAKNKQISKAPEKRQLRKNSVKESQTSENRCTPKSSRYISKPKEG